MRYMVYNGYYKVMSNIPKMGHLTTPESCVTRGGNPRNARNAHAWNGPLGVAIIWSLVETSMFFGRWIVVPRVKTVAVSPVS